MDCYLVVSHSDHCQETAQSEIISLRHFIDDQPATVRPGTDEKTL